MRARWGTIRVVGGAVALLAGCGKPAALSADHAWVRLAAVPDRPAAAYVTLHGGAADAQLVAAASPAALRAEMHESMAGGMRPLTAVPLPAGASIAFAPGGRHIMLFDVDPRVRPGTTVPLTLRFADGRVLTVRAETRGPADPPPP